MSLNYVDLNKCGARLYYERGAGLRLTCVHGHTGTNDVGSARSFVFCPICLEAEEERAKRASLVTAATAEEKDHVPATAPVACDTSAARRHHLIESIYKLKRDREQSRQIQRWTGSLIAVKDDSCVDELIQRLERELEFLYTIPSDKEPVVPNPRV